MNLKTINIFQSSEKKLVSKSTYGFSFTFSLCFFILPHVFLLIPMKNAIFVSHVNTKKILAWFPGGDYDLISESERKPPPAAQDRSKIRKDNQMKPPEQPKARIQCS